MARNSQSTSTDTDATAAADATVTVSDSGVEVSPTVSDEFKPVEMYHRTGKTRTVHTLEAKYAAEFDGFSTEKPKKKR